MRTQEAQRSQKRGQGRPRAIMAIMAIISVSQTGLPAIAYSVECAMSSLKAEPSGPLGRQMRERYRCRSTERQPAAGQEPDSAD